MKIINKKIIFILTISLIVLTTISFSIFVVLAAIQTSVKGSVSIEYYKPSMLISGELFNEYLTTGYDILIFDYGNNYPEIISNTTSTTKAVDVDELGYEAGGITLYKDVTNKTMYVLSKGEIYANEDCSFMFATPSQQHNLSNIVFNNFNTSLTTNMGRMFRFCDAIKSLNLSSFDTSKVESMVGMFEGCSELLSLDLSGFDTSKVETMSGMFSNCSQLNSLDLSFWDTSNVGSMEETFENCYKLTELDLSSFDTTSLTNTYGMFFGCEALKTIYVGHRWNTTPQGVAMSSGMFSQCVSLVGGNGTVYDSSYGILYARIDGYNDLPGYFTVHPDTKRTLNNYEISNIMDEGGCGELYFSYYEDCAEIISNLYITSVRAIDVLGYGHENGGISLYKSGAIFYVVSDDVIYADSDCSNLLDPGYTPIIKFDNFNTSKVTSMSKMFYGMDGITDLDLSGFDTSRVKNMDSMFYGCLSLTSLDLSGFNTSKVTNMAGVFNGCSSLEKLDLSAWKTDYVTDMSNMFNGCSALKELNISSFDLTNVEGVTNMMNFGSGNNVNLIYLPKKIGTNSIPVTTNSVLFTQDGCDMLDSSSIASDFEGKVLVRKHTIKAEADGGTLDDTWALNTLTVLLHGQGIASLPNATKEGYVFMGWYDALEGGNKIEIGQTFDGDTTIYAHWEAE